MAKLTKWLRKTLDSVIDPEREDRLKKLSGVIYRGLKADLKRFSLSESVAQFEPTPRDLAEACERVFRRIVERVWADGQVTDSEMRTVNRVSVALELGRKRADSILLEFARDQFASFLAAAMQDGELDAGEQERLEHIASTVGLSMPDFARSFFKSEGESFLRSVFLDGISDGHLSRHEWKSLLTTSQQLGIPDSELQRVIRPQARQFVEHVLADAKSDGRLSSDEEATLAWLISTLDIGADFHRYVTDEVAMLRLLTDIADGKLPSLSPPAGIQTKAGELIHSHDGAVWIQIRQLKSGPREDRHQGTLTLTDNRLIFSSPTKSKTINYRRIVRHAGGDDWIDVLVDGKPVSRFALRGHSQIPYLILSAAVSMANQTKTAKQADRTRHIPRDVRQRVWQRYGGRCAECGAEDYLEFDHVIPVAKGGSNSDANVQLLCRRCNLKKSDHI